MSEEKLTLYNKKEKIYRKYLWIYVGITFGLSWGMSVLYIIFYDTLAPFVGELNISNPFVMVSLNSPSIAGIIIYFIYGGFQGMESFLKCLIPNKKECIWFPILFGLSLLFYLCMHFGSKYFGILRKNRLKKRNSSLLSDKRRDKEGTNTTFFFLFGKSFR